MQLAFESLRWLWLLPICVSLVWVVELRWPIGEGWSRWAGAMVRTMLLVGLVIAAAGPVRFRQDAGVSAVVVVDVSASVSDEQLKRTRQLVMRLQSLARPPHDLRVVQFAAVPLEVIPPSRFKGAAHDPVALAAAVTRLDGELGLATDIARALGLAAGLADPARQRRVLLISDGYATAGDALTQAQRVGTVGIRLDYLRLDAPVATADVAIDSMSAPPDIRPHATFPLRIRLATDRSARVRVTVTRNGRALDGPEGGARNVSLSAGETTLTWDTRVDGGDPTVFAAEVRPIEGRRVDAHPENDRALLALAAPAPPRVLVLAGTASDGAALVVALRAQSIDVQMVAGSRPIAAVLKPVALSGTDLIVLCDLPRGALVDRHLALLDAYVRDGGGLLVTGGPQAFGPGGWQGTRLESLLPLRLDEPRQRDEPALALALAIDRSGSMSGAKMDLTKQAARGTAELLPVDDQISVIAFDSQATIIVPLQRAANRLRISTDIARIQPTGGTNILAGLREAIDQLAAARASKKHIILLSDGQSATEGIAELVDAAVLARITISTVGVGEGVDEAVLQLIARHGGGRYYHTRDPASIPRIFTRETSEVATSSIVERATAAIPKKRAAMTDGIAWGDSPPLRGFVRTHLRPQGELLLAGDGGDPLLARWAVGLGQVVAWTSDLGPRWAGAWTRWPPFAKIWGQIARASMRARAARQFPLVTRLDGGIVDVTVEAVSSDDRFLVGLDAMVEITEVAPDGALATGPPRRIALTESAPGRYDARFGVTDGPGAPPGALMMRATLNREGQPVAQALGHLSIPLAPELRPVIPGSPGAARGAALLASIAAVTGGGSMEAPATIFQGSAPRRKPQSLRPVLLGFLAMLFVLEIALRRLTENRKRAAGSAP